MSQDNSNNNFILEIEKEYQEFLEKLDLLKKEQEKIIAEYRDKLEQQKLAQLRKELDLNSKP